MGARWSTRHCSLLTCPMVVRKMLDIRIIGKESGQQYANNYTLIRSGLAQVLSNARPMPSVPRLCTKAPQFVNFFSIEGPTNFVLSNWSIPHLIVENTSTTIEEGGGDSFSDQISTELEGGKLHTYDQIIVKHKINKDKCLKTFRAISLKLILMLVSDLFVSHEVFNFYWFMYVSFFLKSIPLHCRRKASSPTILCCLLPSNAPSCT